MTEGYRNLPGDLVVPTDDGAADHLRGSEVPSMTLSSTLGGQLDLGMATERLTVVYMYPRTGVPGEPLPAGGTRSRARAAARPRAAPSATTCSSSRPTEPRCSA